MGVIDDLRAKDPDTLTGKERKMLNLNPAKKGEVRNPNGRKKGSKNFSTHFRNLMEDENFLKTVVTSMPSQWQGMVSDTPAGFISAAYLTVILKSLANSVKEGNVIDRDTRELISQLNKMAFGDKVVIEPESDDFFQRTVLNFNVVPSREKDEDES